MCLQLPLIPHRPRKCPDGPCERGCRHPECAEGEPERLRDLLEQREREYKEGGKTLTIRTAWNRPEELEDNTVLVLRLDRLEIVNSHFRREDNSDQEAQERINPARLLREPVFTTADERPRSQMSRLKSPLWEILERGRGTARIRNLPKEHPFGDVPSTWMCNACKTLLHFQSPDSYDGRPCLCGSVRWTHVGKRAWETSAEANLKQGRPQPLDRYSPPYTETLALIQQGW